MKNLLKFIKYPVFAGSLFLVWYAITKPFNAPVAKIPVEIPETIESPATSPLPEVTDNDRSANTPPPIRTDILPSTQGSVQTSVEPSPEITVTPYPSPTPSLAPSFQAEVREPVLTSESVNGQAAYTPNGFNGWRLRRDPCISDSCTFPENYAILPGTPLFILPENGIARHPHTAYGYTDAEGYNWIKVRVYYSDTILTGYLAKQAVVFNQP